MSEKIKKDRERILNSLDDEHFSTLTTRQATFVREFVKDGMAKKSALAAGYTEGGASRAASRLLAVPAVQAVIKRVRDVILKEAEYNLDKALIEVDEAVLEAKKAKQYNAVAKLLELKTKLTGLYQDRMTIDHNIKGGFTVQVQGIAPPKYATETIDISPEKIGIEASIKKT